MYIEYDDESNGAFVWLVDDIDLIKQSVTREFWPEELHDEIGLLFTEEGRLIGLEIQPASRYLDEATLKKARTYPE